MVEFTTARDLMRMIAWINSSYRLLFQRRLRQNNIDLTYEMFQVMNCLWREDGINQQELGKRTIKDKANLTYLINNLEKRQLVFRQESEEDGRSKKIFLTPSGKSLEASVMPHAREIYMSVMNNFDEEHLQQSIHYLKELNEVFKRQI